MVSSMTTNAQQTLPLSLMAIFLQLLSPFDINDKGPKTSPSRDFIMPRKINWMLEYSSLDMWTNCFTWDDHLSSFFLNITNCSFDLAPCYHIYSSQATIFYFLDTVHFFSQISDIWDSEMSNFDGSLLYWWTIVLSHVRNESQDTQIWGPM